MIDTVAQIAIAFFGVLCVWYTAKGVTFRACLFGLLGEPFWLTTAVLHRQPAVVLLSVVYGVLFFVGIWRSARSEGK